MLKERKITIRKLNIHGVEVFAYPGSIIRTLAAGVVVDAAWTRPAMALGYTTFEPGDRFTEWFFSDRWYNIMEVRDQRGRLKGWYCNVTWPAEIAPGSVSYRDLILDLWVAPNGALLTLDMDEFEAADGLSAEVRAHALVGLTEARAHIERREAPFDALQEQPV